MDEASIHTESFPPNPPVTEFITTNIATTTYTKINCGISKIEKFFTLEIVSIGDICP